MTIAIWIIAICLVLITIAVWVLTTCAVIRLVQHAYMFWPSKEEDWDTDVEDLYAAFAKEMKSKDLSLMQKMLGAFERGKQDDNNK